MIRFTKNLAEKNRKTFGNGRLDCCDINQSNINGKKILKKSIKREKNNFDGFPSKLFFSTENT